MKLFRALTAILTVCACAWVGILFAQCEEQENSIDTDKLIIEMSRQISELETKVAVYEEYYKATEEFLDTLENHFNWVDGFDPMPYYESVGEVLKVRTGNESTLYSWEICGMFSDIIRMHKDHCPYIQEAIDCVLGEKKNLLEKYSYCY